ncbi:hypothetical protein EXIGLDRAFT_776757 [Exidia glandulosa HHB12029]|uniref:Uncharacterized protein n=1 Tax=Exidia glandulosa HHB12029 TaxID=1314781 RepID=A0A165DCA5_EXIGL|nr:hypothetical protein EXIGLDRAFT_776757 [Exidia glandulosa HHB12029]
MLASDTVFRATSQASSQSPYQIAANYQPLPVHESFAAYQYQVATYHYQARPSAPYLENYQYSQPRPLQPLNSPPRVSGSKASSFDTATSTSKKRRLALDDPDGQPAVKKRASSTRSEGGRTLPVPTAVCATCNKSYVLISTHFTRAAKSGKVCAEKRRYRRLVNGRPSEETYVWDRSGGSGSGTGTRSSAKND